MGSSVVSESGLREETCGALFPIANRHREGFVFLESLRSIACTVRALIAYFRPMATDEEGSLSLVRFMIETGNFTGLGHL